MSDIENLNHGQSLAVKRAIMWYNLEDKIYFRLGGFAGTGKTYTIHYIIKELGLESFQVAFCAYTGNATLQLIRKGNRDAKTIHKLIYETEIEEIPVYDKKDPNKVIRIDKISHTYKKTELENPNIKLIVCDEYSMASNEILKDLMSFGIKVLLVGDSGQLPPVKGENDYTNEYEAELTEIVRQGKDSPIIDLSLYSRKKIAIPYGNYGENDEVLVYPKYYFDEKFSGILKWADQIIVGKNKTRTEMNKASRKILGYYDKSPFIPADGDKVVCTNNNWKISAYSAVLGTFIPLVNGSRGYVLHVNSVDWTNKYFSMDFVIDFDEKCIFRDLVVSFKNFDPNYNFSLDLNPDRKNLNLNEFDYGYAITCHKTQGNQYPKTALLVESLFYDPVKRVTDVDMEKKWLYTGITRAEKELMIFYEPKYYYNKSYKKSEEYYEAVADYSED